MRDYALCGARFSGSSWQTTTKQRHVSVPRDQTTTCPKCLKLIAEQQVSEPAQVTVVINDSPTEAHTHRQTRKLQRVYYGGTLQRMRNVSSQEPSHARGNLDGDDGHMNSSLPKFAAKTWGREGFVMEAKPAGMKWCAEHKEWEHIRIQKTTCTLP